MLVEIIMADFPKLPRIKQDDETMEKLHGAARRGQLDVLRKIIASGVNPNIPNKFGCTALHLACKFGHEAIVRELTPVSEINAVWHGQRPIHYAVLAKNEGVVKMLVDCAREQGKLPEYVLSEIDDVETSDIGPEPGKKRVFGQTVLHWCVGLGAAYLPMLKFLIALGAPPTCRDKFGETPLVRAIEFNNMDAFKALLEGKPLRLEVCDKNAQSHLHWAMKCGRPDLAKMLIERGHDLTFEDHNKNSIISLSIRAAMPVVLEPALEAADLFAVQSIPFHNGTTVVLERIEWLPHISENDPDRAEVIRLLQKKLDAINKSNPAPKRPVPAPAPTVPTMTLAPSAPIKLDLYPSRSHTK